MTTSQSAGRREAKRAIELRGFLSRFRLLRAIRRGGALSRGEEGNTIVEMALASTILLGTLIGLFEMSLALYTYHYISDAAREGTRYAIVRGSHCTGLTNCPDITGDQIQTYVRGLGLADASKMTVTTTWYTIGRNDANGNIVPTFLTLCSNTAPAGCDIPGINEVQVQVVYHFPLNIPFMSFTMLNIQSTSEMAISQ